MNGRDLKIIYMGTPDFAVAPLRRLVDGGYNVVAVVTAPDKPVGRGQKMGESAVKRYAAGAGLTVLQPEKLKDPGFVERLKGLDADLGIVIAFRMLPEAVWSAPRMGTFNLHASLLPDYRGAAPINRALINGETRTGVTTFLLDRDIDTGDILAQREVAIDPQDNAGTLHDKLMAAGSDLVVETIEMLARGEVEPLKQSVGKGLKVRPAPKIFPDDCRIDWSRDAGELHNLVRGLSPYPGAWTYMWRGGEQETVLVKVFASAVEKADAEPAAGEIVSDGRTFLKVGCGDGYLHITELQVAGKRRMGVGEFLRGFKIEGYSF